MTARAKAGLRFGTAGTPHSANPRNPRGALRRIHELGLGCLELEFVYGVRMGEEMAKEVRALARELDIALTVHAPYYINLLSKEPEKLWTSRERILSSARVGAAAGATGVAFHPGFYKGLSAREAYSLIRRELGELARTLRDEGCPARLHPETTGKKSQFGSLEEILRLSAEVESVRPCIDFAHLHARASGGLKDYEDFCIVLDLIKRSLGEEALRNLHIHVAGIQYGARGERHHLNLAESDMNYEGLLRALCDFDVSGVLICESPNLEEDALLMQKYHRTLARTEGVLPKPLKAGFHGKG